MKNRIDEVADLLGKPNCGCVPGETAARELAEAGHLMPDTVDDLQWQYGVEVRPDEDSEWQHTGPWWDTIEKARAWRGTAVIRIGQPYTHARLVRRVVGPVEEVEE